MLCDNSTYRADDIKLTRVKLTFLSPNTASLIQPMDKRLTANFMTQYRSLVLQRLVNDSGMPPTNRAAKVTRKLTAPDSLPIKQKVGNKITPWTVANCYRIASFFATYRGE